MKEEMIMDENCQITFDAARVIRECKSFAKSNENCFIAFLVVAAILAGERMYLNWKTKHEIALLETKKRLASV